MRKSDGRLIFSPSDLIGYLASPFASWMDRYHLEHPGELTPDAESEEKRLIAETGDQHERTVLEEFEKSGVALALVPREDVKQARAETLIAISEKVPIIYQAALECMPFSGFADFLMLDSSGNYQVWDTKLARSPKPYYAIQLCCYSEMLATATGNPMPEKFGIILGTQERVEFRVEDFFHIYSWIKAGFLAMQEGFTGAWTARPEPLPRADHGRWTTHAEDFFDKADHLVRVADISVGQIKKLKAAGISTLTELANAPREPVPRMVAGTMSKLIDQAKLQKKTKANRRKDPNCPPCYEVLPHVGKNGEGLGLATLPKKDAADVFFDMEGFPLVAGGLEYLFGASTIGKKAGALIFHDWWAHDREGEKAAFEGFIEWVFDRWQKNPRMHIYHYAAYEVSAIRRLSTRHDTRQEEVDALLRGRVFVDLYQVVRRGLRIGEESYSIKLVEHLYRTGRKTDVATAVDSIVQYARWIAGGEPRDWKHSSILKGIRDYNEDDCRSTAELVEWLRGVAEAKGIPSMSGLSHTEGALKELPPEADERIKIAGELRAKGDPVSVALGDLLDFHRREEKRLYDFWCG